MNFDGSFDIILFAAIAGVLLWRLRGVLGERREGEPPPFTRNPFAPSAPKPPEAMDGDIATAQLTDAALRAPSWSDRLPDFQTVATATVHNQLAPFVAIEPRFSPADFLDKAKRAFGMILAAYADGDRKTLEFLLAPNLYQAFATQIEGRATRGETYTAQLHGIQSAVISNAQLSGTTATLTVDITAQQTVTHKDAHGQTLATDADGTKRTTTDRWSFQKDLRDPNPLWLLVKTAEIDD